MCISNIFMVFFNISKYKTFIDFNYVVILFPFLFFPVSQNFAYIIAILHRISTSTLGGNWGSDNGGYLFQTDKRTVSNCSLYNNNNKNNAEKYTIYTLKCNYEFLAFNIKLSPGFYINGIHITILYRSLIHSFLYKPNTFGVME